MSLERTLILVKPDGLQRGLVGEVISRLERRGLKLLALKLLRMDQPLARKHYEAHLDKPFFATLSAFITSGPLVAAAFEGSSAVQAARQTMGATDPVAASAGTIRGDYALDIGRNIVHGSDSPEAAERELALFFGPEDLVSWDRDGEHWVTE